MVKIERSIPVKVFYFINHIKSCKSKIKKKNEYLEKTLEETPFLKLDDTNMSMIDCA